MLTQAFISACQARRRPFYLNADASNKGFIISTDMSEPCSLSASLRHIALRCDPCVRVRGHVTTTHLRWLFNDQARLAQTRVHVFACPVHGHGPTDKLRMISRLFEACRPPAGPLM